MVIRQSMPTTTTTWRQQVLKVMRHRPQHSQLTRTKIGLIYVAPGKPLASCYKSRIPYRHRSLERMR